jgi:hypothetical protein
MMRAPPASASSARPASHQVARVQHLGTLEEKVRKVGLDNACPVPVRRVRHSSHQFGVGHVRRDPDELTGLDVRADDDGKVGQLFCVVHGRGR